MSQPLDDEQVRARIEEFEREQPRLRRDEREAADVEGRAHANTVERYSG